MFIFTKVLLSFKGLFNFVYTLLKKKTTSKTTAEFALQHLRVMVMGEEILSK